MADSIETSYQAAIDTGKINGAVICATDTEGRFVYNQALGQRTLLSGEKCPQQLDDVLYLASATKLVAAIAALQFAPELATKQVLTGVSEDGETPLLDPATHPITLEMLLTHSSGLVYYFCDPQIAKWREKFAPPQEGKRLPVEELFCYPLSFQPGNGFMYGPGLDWAGRIVERVTGRTLGAYMQERIFDPLGIDDAQFYPVTREELRSRLVDLNPADPDCTGRAVLGGESDTNKRCLGDFGGQGLFMSGTSYVKILHSLLANDRRLLKPATVDDMFQHHLSPEATAAYQTALTGPLGPHFRLGTDLNTKSGYGMSGMLTLQDIDGWYGERTLTWGGGLTLTWFIDRKNGLCGVGAVQASLPLDYATVGALKQTFRRDIYRKYASWKENQ
ncbi:Transesterase LovD [Aspergillus sclerotialis]|uniref:Transesterase LovD n=1 Tax=Aspergillus sclerotialis TaxID=2070753 RepID=A0A3A2Z981_9EURO|nr:Transesterase LovD [Aspergillus sclerotialis]